MLKILILTIAALALPFSHADQTKISVEDPIVISGTGFELKLSEVRRYLQDQLSDSGMEVTDVEVNWALLGKMDLVFEDKDYTVNFKMRDTENQVTYEVSCYLLASSDFGYGDTAIHASDCESNPSARFHFEYKSLRLYTNVRSY